MPFQSTLPARGATSVVDTLQLKAGISIHAPRTGSDRKGAVDVLLLVISIHAPRTGSDGGAGAVRGGKRSISIHAPRTGSDGGGRIPTLYAQSISIHAPRTGSDKHPNTTRRKPPYFNPRSPHGERQSTGAPLSASQGISIHAPRTGSDKPPTPQNIFVRRFQSTLPARGATPKRPRRASRKTFQSTLPARGATTTGYKRRSTS